MNTSENRGHEILTFGAPSVQSFNSRGECREVRGSEGIPTPNNQVRSQDTGRHDADAGLGHAIRGAEGSKDDGGGAAHGAKEGLSASGRGN